MMAHVLDWFTSNISVNSLSDIDCILLNIEVSYNSFFFTKNSC